MTIFLSILFMGIIQSLLRVCLDCPVGMIVVQIAFNNAPFLRYLNFFQDVVILNKVDLVSANLLEELEKEIHHINSLANIIHSTRCQVDLSKILNCQAYDATVSLLICLYE